MIKKFLLLIFLFISYSFAQQKIILNSDLLPSADTCLIFTPQKFDITKKYPLIFLLHGYSGNYNQWNDVTDLQYYSNKYNFIIVCPDGFYSCWYVDSPINPKLQFQTFFFNVLVKDIFSKFNIDKRNIFISGLSMGGFGAINLFLSKPDFFKSAGSTSGILDIIEYVNRWKMESVIGKYEDNKNVYEKLSPLLQIRNLKSFDKKLIIDCGTEDFAYGVNKKFYEECLKKNIPVTFISQSGNHNYQYWRKSIEQHFDFFSKLIPK